MSTPTVTGSSRIRLYPLEIRADDDQAYVGRMETGHFVALPPIAIEVLHLLREGLSTSETATRLQETHGRDINVRGFVEKIVELGYVAAVDEEPIPGPEPIRPTWPWLRPQHTRWTLSPVTAVVVLAVPILAVVALFFRPDLIPSYHKLLWSSHTSLIIAGNAVIAWTIIVLHESAHLFTARAVGVPGRIGFGTRLQFLSVQTDVTGVWAAPKRVRLTVYLSGIAVNLFISGAALLLGVVIGTDQLAGRLLGAMALVSLAFVPTQLLLFMRTDLYFVLQDLARCANLYADGSAYVRYRARRGWQAITGRGEQPVDPSAKLLSAERRAVRAYAPILAVGTALCLLFAAVVSVPTGVTVLTRALRNVAGAGSGSRLDGLLTLIITGGFWLLWCRAWWRGHGGQVTGWWNRHRPAKERG